MVDTRIPEGYRFRDNPNRPYTAGPMDTPDGKPLGIMLHIVTGVKDYDGLDGSAEAMARTWTVQTTSSSWHDLIDADSRVKCLPPTWKAWHSKYGLWRTSIGIEIATDLTDWTKKPAAWVDGCLTQLARCCARYVVDYDLPITLNRNRADVIARSDAGRKFGFTYHAVVDPDRRTDPGMVAGRDTFPWAAFETKLRAEVTRLKGGTLGSTTGTTKPTTGTTRVLQIGSKGEDVRRLQDGLNRVFPSYSRLVEDGSYGPATAAVVKEFQSRSRLTADGIVGTRTREALNKNGVRF